MSDDVLPPANQLFSRLNEDGLIEVIDEMTGNVISVQSSHQDLLKTKRERLIEHTLPDGTKVYLEKGLSLDRIHPKSYAFSQIVADIICQKIIEGDSMTKICEDPNFPSVSIVAKWKKMNDDFATQVRASYQSRADHYHDKVLSEAEKTKTKDDAPAQKVKIDAYKWAAEKGNPEQYGNRTKLIGDPNAPLQLIINTGIDRGPDDLKDVTSTDAIKQLEDQDGQTPESEETKTEEAETKEVNE